jgi:RNA polymerase sigma-70 factor (ECF subfamily)
LGGAELETARRGDQQAFARLAEPYRRELLAHCYRLLGSAQEAEDLVQETMLRAWRRLETYAGRAPFRAWLYRIATNACLDALERRPRRWLPTLAYAAADPEAPIRPPILEPVWLEPFPDDWLGDTTTLAGANPEARYTARESVRLAFVAALQTLPPRQRAVLILRDVLDWPAAEAAGCLDMTVSAVNSALHRARSRLAQQPQLERERRRTDLPDADAQRLLERYVNAWETADVAGLVALLREEAVVTMPPSPTWCQGADSIRRFAAGNVFAGQARGRWHLRPVGANGQPAFGVYQRSAEGNQAEGVGIQVLTLEGAAVARMDTFMTPALLGVFGLPGRV